MDFKVGLTDEAIADLKRIVEYLGPRQRGSGVACRQ
jgi:hypothetical protein